MRGRSAQITSRLAAAIIALSARLRGERAGATGRVRRCRVPVVAGIFLTAVATAVYFTLPPPPLDRGRDASVLVLASDGSILRGFLTADGKWRLPIEPDKVDPLYRRMLIAAEDARFAWHPGVDPFAVLRGAAQLARSAGMSCPAPRP